MSCVLVFLFKCLNGATDLNVHNFVSFFPSHGRHLAGVLVCCMRVLHYRTSIIRVIPNKAVEKKKKTEEAYPHLHEYFWGN